MEQEIFVDNRIKLALAITSRELVQFFGQTRISKRYVDPVLRQIALDLSSVTFEFLPQVPISNAQYADQAGALLERVTTTGAKVCALMRDATYQKCSQFRQQALIDDFNSNVH
eukprot:TRINITY_DN39915_c0_g1_i1.p3 TRINITY_DN39915_c0_g1~~TRINITY_DN39915_c0_g1_i1.p3  ORF type:complete len:113 (-),score=13.71 TRINITY_DN39915_c0_g1_i1:431-769(-)